MSWQEELRRLDDELADGLISATDYRRRSEDLIATASAAPARPAATRPVSRPTATEQRQAEPHTGEQPAVHPATTPEPREPEPVSAEQESPEQAEPEARGAAEVDPELPAPGTAAAPEPAPGPPRRTDAAPAGEQPARTPGVPPPFAPARPSPVDEAFAPARSRRRVRRPAPRLAAGLAVLVLAAVAVWLFGFGPLTPGTGRATSGTASAAPVRIPHGLAAKLDSLPGRRVTAGDTVPVGRLADLGICSAGQAATLRADGVSKVLYLTSVEDGKAFSVAVVPHHGRKPAAGTAADVLATQRGHRFAASGGMGLPRGVTVLARTGNGGTRLRAVYTAGTDTVVVGAASPHGPREVATEFRRLATHVTGVLPSG